jgi:protein tyrosine/serine phosphatase
VTVNWIELDGLVNLRDLGGTPTTDGAVIAPGRLLRSDNLQTLTRRDVTALLDLGLTDVIDLRSDLEVGQEGPGPLTREPSVTIHHHSMFKEALTTAETETELTEQLNETRSAEEIKAKALPWTEIVKPTVEVADDSASFYLSYLVDRPDSVVAALRAIAGAEGAALVHCAAGKDRTGTITALSLLLAGVDRRYVVEDYARSAERIDQILAKLAASDTYRDNVLAQPADQQTTRPETMEMVCDYIATEYGSVENLLHPMGWTQADTAAIRTKLRAA